MGSPAENPGVKQREADVELPAPEIPILPQPPEPPTTGQQPEQTQTIAFTELDQGKPRILSMEEPVEFVLTAENTFSQASPSGQNASEPTQSVFTAGDTAQTEETETTTSQATTAPEIKPSSQEENGCIVYGPRPTGTTAARRSG